MVALGLIFCGCAVLSADDRWEGRRRNGEIVTGTEIADWNEPTSQPTFAGRPLQDAENPLISLIDRQTPTPVPTAYVEFSGGDRISGELIGYRAAAENPYEPLPPHLLLKPLAELSQPDFSSGAGLIRLSTRWVKRVVREPVNARFTPSTVWLRGGGQVEFRSLRWGAEGVTLLTEAGLRTLAFADLAEIHLPAADDWQAYPEMLAVLTPDLSATLLQIETRDGSRFTTSTERFQARHWGDRKRNESWLQFLQPTWAFDPVWVRYPTVTGWRWFDPAEPPLSWSDPDSIRREAIFGGSWHWQRDLNVFGHRLAANDHYSTRGFGVHGSTDLIFALPPFAEAIRTRCGLDRAAGTGGSVQLSIHDGTEQELFRSEPLVGSSRQLETPWMKLPAATADSDESRTIVLRSDMLRENAPEGADPFDIRDIVNWNDPTVKFQRNALQAAVRTQLVPAIRGLSNWRLSEADTASLRVRNVLDETDHRSVQFREVWSTTHRYLSLTRPVRVTSRDRWLALVTSRFENQSRPARVQVKIDGVSSGEFELPVRQGPIDPQPILASIPAGPDRTVQLQVVFYLTEAAESETWWELRGLHVSREPPGIRTLFDEERPDWLATAQDRVELVTVDADNADAGTGDSAAAITAYSGRTALRLPAGRVEFPQEDPLTATISDLPKLGEFRFLTFAWKGAETPGLVLSLAHDGWVGADIANGLGLELGPRGNARNRGSGRRRRLEDRGLRHGFSWDAGNYTPAATPPLRIVRQVPEDWKWESRDVASDFGPIQLTGFGLECVSKGVGWFDAIVLARSPQDVDWLKRRYESVPAASSDATYSHKATRVEDWGPAVARFAPAFATADAPHGILQKRLHQGQTDGWQTHPLDRERPFQLRTVHTFPDDRPQELDILVSHPPDHEFRLVVRVNGTTVFDQPVNNALTQSQRGWASLKVDLAEFQGQTALIEVANQFGSTDQPYAVWKRLHIRNQSP